MPSRQRVLVLGAGFGGLELTSILSATFGDTIDLVLIDRSDAFVFGFSKLDVMFGRATLDSVRIPYRSIAKPGVRVLQHEITAIDPAARRVTTDAGTFEADFLVIALGADYALDATPGLAEFGQEFYSVAGAARVRELLPAFPGGRIIVGVCGAPYKCPPAPSETALLLHDYFETRGIRDRCEITAVLPWASPVPPSPDTSRALVAAFAERRIGYIPNHRVKSLDGARRVAVLDDGAELPFDLFLGIPKHCVPKVVAASGMAADGWIKVNPRTLESSFPGVYAIGDVSNTGAPKAGVFAEGAGRAVASSLVAALGRGGVPELYAGAGTCYIEFGGDRVAKVDIDFFTGPKPAGHFGEPSPAVRTEKHLFGSSRRSRWFGT